MAQTLRHYQVHALNELRDGIRNGVMAQLLMAPTGAGKTTVASAIKQGAVAKGNRAFFVVDSLELVDQAVERFSADGLEVGVIQADHWLTDYSKPVQVATIQTLRSRWKHLTERLMPKLVVIDEAHVLHKAHMEIIADCVAAKIPVIGLSATPFRKGLGQVFNRLVKCSTLPELTDLGFLVPAQCYAPSIPELKGVKTGTDGDWIADSLAEVMGEAKLVGDVVETWHHLARERQTIVFACNVAHSKALAAQFQLAGVKAAHIDGYMEQQERDCFVRAFRKSELRVLCNVGVLTKGFDAPETSCVVLARPTKSLMLHIQMMGRGLRTATGKNDCIIIDHAGNCLRNGVPTDELPDELDMGEGANPDRKDRKKAEERGEREARPCPRCTYLFKLHTCPACGFKPELRQDVEWVEGKLVPIGQATAKKFSPAQKRDIFAQLLWYARKNGKQDGWAYHKCKEYCGSAPANTRQIAPMQISAELSGWVRHKAIQWAKRRSAA